MTSLLNLQKALPSIYKQILGSAFLSLFIRMKYFNRRLFFTNLFIGSHSKEAPNAPMTSSPVKFVIGFPFASLILISAFALLVNTSLNLSLSH